MEDSAKQRYAELPEKEQATFITTKAKELGMSANVIRQLMNSAFVFASHVDKIHAEGKLTHYYVKTFDGRKLPRWDIKFNIPIRVSVYIYRSKGLFLKTTFKTVIATVLILLLALSKVMDVIPGLV